MCCPRYKYFCSPHRGMLRLCRSCWLPQAWNPQESAPRNFFLEIGELHTAPRTEHIFLLVEHRKHFDIPFVFHCADIFVRRWCASGCVDRADRRKRWNSRSHRSLGGMLRVACHRWISSTDLVAALPQLGKCHWTPKIYKMRSTIAHCFPGLNLFFLRDSRTSWTAPKRFQKYSCCLANYQGIKGRSLDGVLCVACRDFEGTQNIQCVPQEGRRGVTHVSYFMRSIAGEEIRSAFV